jgi:PAS domain S-box-containing protein
MAGQGSSKKSKGVTGHASDPVRPARRKTARDRPLPEEQSIDAGARADAPAGSLDREQIDESLREARARLEAAMHGSEFATWTWDIENNRVHAGKNLARFFSLGPEDAAGGPIEHYLRAVHPEDRARVEAAVAEALKSESGSYEADYRIVRPDGSVLWVAARGQVERDSTGRPVRFPGVVIDISAWKQAETEQAEQTRVLGLIAQGAPLSETLEVLVRMIEQQARTGILGSILLLEDDGVHLLHGAAPSLPAAYNQAIDGIEIGPSVGSCGTAAFLKKSVRVTDIATDPLWANFTGLALEHGLRACWSTPIFSSSGQLLGTFALYYLEAREPDATDERLVELATRSAAIAIERSRAEEALRESAERFRFLAESMPQKIFTAKPNGEVDYINQQWTDFTGLSFEQVRDWGWVQLVHPEDVEENVRRWKHSVATQEPFYLEHRFRRADGAYRWHVTRAVPMRDAEGKTIMWIGSNTEIEEVRQAKEAAERASRSKDEFLATLSHELRTPLTPVLLMASALRKDEDLPLEVREQLGMMQRNVELEARLIDDLLDLTRIARGKLQLRAEPCDVHALVALSLEMVRGEATRKKQTLEVDLVARRSQLTGDPARLQQVFWNLLNNAVKFTPEAGRVTLRSRDFGGALALEISDTGIGIEAEALDRIFQSFEQGPRTTGRHRFGGLGLGLAISKAIVDRHGGNIQAHSAGVGTGSVFRVELPARENVVTENIAPGTEPGNGERRARRGEFSPLRLLVVEDHEPTLAVLENLLTRAGHRVATATSVASALERAADPNHFDVLISDVGLPDGTGFELMGKLHAQQKIRGVALSGYGMDDDLRCSREAGFSKHLIKPIDFAQLNRALAELMSD